MVTPIVMLLLLTTPYAVARGLSALTHRDYDVHVAAAIGVSLLFVFTGIGHFIQTEAMSEMLPPWVPARELIIYATGMLEFAIAAGFLFTSTRRITGWIAIVVLVLFFPANIYAAMNHVAMGGHAWGPVYLLIRAPVQIIIALWCYWFVIRMPQVTGRSGQPSPV